MARDSSERIIQAATRLFASKGYYGTSMREIAREVGLTVATVQQHAGSKENLYCQVFRRQYEMDHQIITASLAAYDEEGLEQLCQDPPRLRQFIKEIWIQLIDRFRATPELVRLWSYRWLERDQLGLDIDRQFSTSLYQIELGVIQKAQRYGTITSDWLEILIWTSGFAWLQMGFFAGRNLIRDLEVNDPFNNESITAFYSFLDRYVDRMIRYIDSDAGHKPPGGTLDLTQKGEKP
jgi:AcrR family transcriptional regulator